MLGIIFFKLSAEKGFWYTLFWLTFRLFVCVGATKSAERARVVCDFEGRKDELLSVRKDDIVTILEKDVQLGLSQAAMDGKVGLLPDDCFKLLPPEEAKDEKVNA